MKKLSGFLVAFSSLFILSLPADAHEAHVHGVAHLNVAVEGQDVDIDLESPLANVLSFEHEPETDAQKQEVRDMAALMHKAENLFVFPTEAECRVKDVALESAVLPVDLLSPKGAESSAEHGKREHTHGEDTPGDAREHEHGDLEAEISFVCKRPEKLDSLKVEMFRAFPNLHEVEVQLVTSKGQSAAELTPEANIVRW